MIFAQEISRELVRELAEGLSALEMERCKDVPAGKDRIIGMLDLLRLGTLKAPICSGIAYSREIWKFGTCDHACTLTHTTGTFYLELGL